MVPIDGEHPELNFKYAPHDGRGNPIGFFSTREACKQHVIDTIMGFTSTAERWAKKFEEMNP